MNTNASFRFTLLSTLILGAAMTTACSSTSIKPHTSDQNLGQVTPPVIIETNIVDATPASMPSPDNATVELIPASDTTESIAAAAPEMPMVDSNLATRPAKILFNFGFNQVKLDDASQQLIEEHGRFLAEHPDVKLIINGHSDGQGDSNYNDALSLKRAEYVADLLMSQGAMKEQIEIFSWGSKAPLADAHSHREQRRVELKYVDEYWVQSTTE